MLNVLGNRAVSGPAGDGEGAKALAKKVAINTEIDIMDNIVDES